MNEISLPRLYLLRALYLLVGVGLAFNVWPGVLAPTAPWELMDGVVRCMLTAFSLLCLLGVRYPLQMLPMMLWEVIWKVLWLGIVAYPQWSAGTMDKGVAANAFACLFVVLVFICVPWEYVYDRYVRQPGNRWR